MATLHRCRCPLKITGVAQHRPVLLRLPRQLLLRLDPSKSRKIKGAGQFKTYLNVLIMPNRFLILNFLFGGHLANNRSTHNELEKNR